MIKDMLHKVPQKYRNRVQSAEKFPSWAGGAPYRLQLKENWEHYEGTQVYQADNLREMLEVIKTAKEVQS